jgi:addiction module HigA family antidote
MKKTRSMPSDAIRKFMVYYGINNTGLADALGVSFSNINNILHNKASMSLKTALKLEKYFRCEKGYFCRIKYAYDLAMVTQDEQFQGELQAVRPVHRLSPAMAKKIRELHNRTTEGRGNNRGHGSDRPARF